MVLVVGDRIKQDVEFELIFEQVEDLAAHLES